MVFKNERFLLFLNIQVGSEHDDTSSGQQQRVLGPGCCHLGHGNRPGRVSFDFAKSPNSATRLFFNIWARSYNEFIGVNLSYADFKHSDWLKILAANQSA